MTGSKATFEAEERFEEPVFSAVIRPHRSLSPQGFRIVMMLLCVISVVASLPFVLMGFWPVAGFFGLDFLGLYIAFQISYRQGRSFELLELTPVRLMLRKVSHRGETREWRFNPLWTRLDREVDDEGHRRLGQFGPLLAASGQRGAEYLVDGHGEERRRRVGPVVDVLGQ